jgi:hypothetical protein
MPSPAYFRRQADICVRLSVIASDQELATRLLAMAEEYKAKAGALETEPPSIQPHMIGQRDLPDGQVDRS